MSGHPCVVLGLNKKALSFSPLSMMSAIAFWVDVLYQVEEVLYSYLEFLS